MPPRMKTNTGKVTVKGQRSDATAEAGIKLMRLAMPWLAWFLLSAATSALRLALYLSARDSLVWTGLAMLALCLLIALFDARLRSHRASWEGRWIGPLTAAAAGLFCCLYLGLGLGLVLCLAWLFTGALGCICWGIWLTVGDHRDLAATFNNKAGAAGVEGAQMVELSRREAGSALDGDQDDLPWTPGPRPPRGRTPKRRPSPRGRAPAREVVEAGLVLPVDPAMTADEVAARLGHAEVVTDSRPGSFAMVASPDAAGRAKVRITPPDLLTAAPIPWPGPSAPGADMSVPFRLALLQTGEPFCYRRLPISHLRVAGKTGSAKTMGLAWNMFGEGITRDGYAAFVADPSKGEQFMGALRPALHELMLAEDERLHLFFARLHKARVDRCNYLGRCRHTEWFPGCGLSFMDCWLEEAGAVLGLLGATQRDKADGMFMLQTWVDDVTAARSAGMSWTASFQKPVKEQSRSTVVTSQMGRVCFALADLADVPFGLSDLQRQRGCRPTLFDNPHGKAMAYFDTETVPEDEKVTPMRFFNWGPGSARIAAYAAEWPARMRPLDEVTGEAMSWTPATSPTSSYAAIGSGAHDNGGKANRIPAKDRVNHRTASKLAAMQKLRDRIIRWREAGRADFQLRHLEPHYAEIGKDRTWFYTALAELCSEGLIAEQEDVRVRTWEIVPAAQLPAPQEEQDDVPDGYGDEEVA